eukprot:snap_masked-scaffold_54-processed-gene-1.44-mRNA-1 protein AED:1.00 eAED:1.00 QI:0/0/0/0/1/1/2/0/97
MKNELTNTQEMNVPFLVPSQIRDRKSTNFWVSIGSRMKKIGVIVFIYDYLYSLQFSVLKYIWIKQGKKLLDIQKKTEFICVQTKHLNRTFPKLSIFY